MPDTSSYVPLRIIARLRCGVISDGLLPIDGVLYAAAHREALGAKTASLARDRVWNEDAISPGKLPLQRIPTTGLPRFYYAASCAQWPTAVADGVDYWTKRIDSRYIDLLEPQRARVSTSGGRYRGYRMPVAYRHALAIAWYVVGEAERIRALLHLVTHLGKKTPMGWGAVQEWIVEPHEEDWSITGPCGRLMRPVPATEGVLYGLAPPYWLPKNQTMCKLPEI